MQRYVVPLNISIKHNAIHACYIFILHVWEIQLFQKFYLRDKKRRRLDISTVLYLSGEASPKITWDIINIQIVNLPVYNSS